MPTSSRGLYNFARIQDSDSDVRMDLCARGCLLDGRGCCTRAADECRVGLIQPDICGRGRVYPTSTVYQQHRNRVPIVLAKRAQVSGEHLRGLHELVELDQLARQGGWICEGEKQEQDLREEKAVDDEQFLLLP